MGGVELPQGYRSTLSRQFTFYRQVPRKSWYSFDRPWKDERVSQPWSHPVVLNTEPLDWESSTLTTRPLLHEPLGHCSVTYLILVACFKNFIFQKRLCLILYNTKEPGTSFQVADFVEFFDKIFSFVI